MISSFLNSAFGFLILMGVLVTLHEFGHFYAAKKLGFKVLTFSIGFGKKVWSRVGKDGVEYRIGMIPLGGYVGFLDDRAHDVKPSEMDQTFNAKPIWKRAIVIAAGPFVNLAFAVVLLFGLYLYGMPAFKAKVDTPLSDSVIAQAGFERGDEVIAIEGRPVRTYEEMMMGFIEYLNDGTASVEINRNGQLRTLEIVMDEPLRLNANQKLEQVLGVNLYLPFIPATIEMVTDDSAAKSAGLVKGDEIIAVNGDRVSNRHEFLAIMHHFEQMDIAEVSLQLTVNRHNQLLEIPLTIERADNQRFMLGVMLGALSPDIIAEFEAMKTLQKYPMIEAFEYAVSDAYHNSLLIFKFIKRMITGEVHLNMMAGPVTIADAAGKTLDAGWVYFIQLMALFSVNLGILNLLPIPVLDGGRLVGLAIEVVAGRNRIPAKLSMMVMQLGALFLFIFMAFVILYDITKWF